MDEVIAFLKKRIDVLNSESMAEDLSIAVAMYYTASTYFAKKEAVYSMNLAKAMAAVREAPGSQKDKELGAKGAVAEDKYKMSVAKGILDALDAKIESLRTLISKAKEELRLTK